MKVLRVLVAVLVLWAVLAVPAVAQNKQKETDYYGTGPQRPKDDVELIWGDDDDVKSLWDSAAALWKLTDSADVLLFSLDPATRDWAITGSLTIGDGSATDFTITVDASANDGVIRWDESAAEWIFVDAITTLGVLHLNGEVLDSTGLLLLASNGNDTRLASVTDVEVTVDSDDNQSTRAFIIWHNGFQVDELFRVQGNTGMTVTGNSTMTGNLALNGGGLTSTGNIEATPAGENFLIDSTNMQLRFTINPTFMIRREDTSILSGNIIGQIGWSGDDAAAANTIAAVIRVVAADDWASGDNGTDMDFFVTTAGGTGITRALRLRDDLLARFEGSIAFQEVASPPSGITNYGMLYTLNDNSLHWIDGSGAHHLLHQEGFSSMWYNGTAITQALTNEDEFTKFTNFLNIGLEDDAGSAVASTGTDDITLSATTGAGKWNSVYHMSVTISGGVADDLLMTMGIELATPLVITDVTNTDPAVVTSASHNLVNGDMVRITGVGGATGVNIDVLVSGKTTDTFEVEDLEGVDVPAGGAYTSGGTITHCFEGEAATYRNVSNSTLGVIAGAAKLDLANSDKIGFYIANLDNAGKNLQARSLRIGVERFGD